MKKIIILLALLWASPSIAQVTSIPCNQLPATTGDVTHPAGSCANTLQPVATITGGSAAGSSLSLKSTTGVGTTDFINFLVGNNGATEVGRFTHSGQLGIGTTAPGSNALVSFSSNATAPPNPGSQTQLQIVGADSASASIGMVSFGAQNAMQFARANGTNASPTASAANDVLGVFGFTGYANGAFVAANKARVLGYSSEAWTSSAQGTYVTVETTATGTTTRSEVARFQPSGGLSIGSTADSGVGTAKLKAQTFASLTACSSTIEGAMASITDSSTATWGATITGSSTNHVLGYCDGTNWTVAGK